MLGGIGGKRRRGGQRMTHEPPGEGSEVEPKSTVEMFGIDVGCGIYRRYLMIHVDPTGKLSGFLSDSHK